MPAEAVMSLRRPVAIAAAVGAVGLLVCGLFGHIVMGILLVVGLGLGLFNTRLLQRSVVKVISSENPSRTAIGRSSLPRLLLITGLAVALGIFLKPDGFGVFLGLAVFQVIILGTTALPVMKERRQ
ncbi:MAG TPA: ATP synthase subunit I [Actinophytocola sp.]|uniref:ATP synthase subunit I n=1 Tax=Actinophytocola sp. TaxID=1872138 RepID=UPI002DF830A5|nr:ATP synthase subunit I [Actinophytocola sp.]